MYNTHLLIVVLHKYCLMLIVWLVNQLRSGDTSVMVRAIKSLRGSVPSADVVKALLVLLTSPTGDVSNETG